MRNYDYSSEFSPALDKAWKLYTERKHERAVLECTRVRQAEDATESLRLEAMVLRLMVLSELDERRTSSLRGGNDRKPRLLMAATHDLLRLQKLISSMPQVHPRMELMTRLCRAELFRRSGNILDVFTTSTSVLESGLDAPKQKCQALELRVWCYICLTGADYLHIRPRLTPRQMIQIWGNRPASHSILVPSALGEFHVHAMLLNCAYTTLNLSTYLHWFEFKQWIHMWDRSMATRRQWELLPPSGNNLPPTRFWEAMLSDLREIAALLPSSPGTIIADPGDDTETLALSGSQRSMLDAVLEKLARCEYSAVDQLLAPHMSQKHGADCLFPYFRVIHALVQSAGKQPVLVIDAVDAILQRAPLTREARLFALVHRALAAAELHLVRRLYDDCGAALDLAGITGRGDLSLRQHRIEAAKILGDIDAELAEFQCLIDHEQSPDIQAIHRQNRALRLQVLGRFTQAQDDWRAILDLPISDCHRDMRERAQKALGIAVPQIPEVYRSTPMIQLFTSVLASPSLAAAERCSALLSRGWELHQAGADDYALADFAELVGDASALPEERLRALLCRASIIEKAGDFAAALIELDQGVEVTDASWELQVEARIRRGCLLEQQEQFEKARDDFDAVLALPNSSELQRLSALYHRTCIDCRLGRQQDAVTTFTSIIDNPLATTNLHLAARMHRGSLRKRCLDLQSAAEDFAIVIETPDCPSAMRAEALYARGQCLGVMGKSKDARADLEAALECPELSQESRENALKLLSITQEGFHPIASIDQALRYLDERDENQQHQDLKVSLQSMKTALQVGGHEYEDAIATCSARIDDRHASPDEWAQASLERASLFQTLENPEAMLEDWNAVAERDDVSSPLRAKSLIHRGLYWVGVNRPDAAIADYSRMLDLPGLGVPEACSARFARGMLLFHECRHDQAVSDFSDVIASDDAPLTLKSSARLMRASVLRVLRRAESALTDLEALLNTAELSAEQHGKALLERGLAYSDLGRFEEALRDLQQVIDAPQSDKEARNRARIQRALVRSRAGQGLAALEEWVEVITDSEVPGEWCMEARSQRRTFVDTLQEAEARELSRRISESLRDTDGERRSVMQVCRGLVQTRFGAWEAANHDFTQVAQAPGIRRTLAIEARLGLGDLRIAQGYYSAAADLHRPLIEESGATDEQRLYARYQRIVAVLSSGALEESMTLLRQFCEDGATYRALIPIARNLWTHAAMAGGKFEEAIEQCEKILQDPAASESTKAQARLQRAQSQLRLGDRAGALEGLRALLQTAPTGSKNEIEARWLLASFQVEDHDYAGAMEHCDELLNRAGTPPEYLAKALYVRSLAFSDLGDHQSAIADLTRAGEIAPDDHLRYEALILRGHAYARLLDRERAVEDFNQVINAAASSEDQKERARTGRDE